MNPLLDRYALISAVDDSKLIQECFSIYPNPVGTDQYLQLEYFTNPNTQIQIDIIDLKGDFIWTLFEGSTTSDRIKERFELPPKMMNGLYFIRIQINGKTLMRQFVSLK